MDIKGLMLVDGEGLIILEDPINIAAGELSDELLHLLQPRKEATKQNPTAVP